MCFFRLRLRTEGIAVPERGQANSFSILAITLLVGIAAGSYPVVVLSQFNPVKVLRGGGNIKGKIISAGYW